MLKLFHSFGPWALVVLTALSAPLQKAVSGHPLVDTILTSIYVGLGYFLPNKPAAA